MFSFLSGSLWKLTIENVSILFTIKILVNDSQVNLVISNTIFDLNPYIFTS